MKLLEQVIMHAVDEKADLPRLLRMCLVLASQLHHEPLKKWAMDELSGYSTGEVPSYRVFQTRLRGVFRNSHYQDTSDIPITNLPEEAHYLRQVHFRPSVSEIMSLLASEKSGGTVRLFLEPEIAAAIGPLVSQNSRCISAWQEFSGLYLEGLIDNLKTKVLNFALEIEREYPDLGDSSKLPAYVNEEKVATIFNTTINGAVANFASGSQNFTQNSGIGADEIGALLACLRDAGVPASDVDTLGRDLQENVPSSKEGLVSRCRLWLGELAMKAVEPEASDVVKSAVTAAKQVLKQVFDS